MSLSLGDHAINAIHFLCDISDKTGHPSLSEDITFFYSFAKKRMCLIHSEKFKLNRNGNSILSENICDLLLV